MKDCTECIGLKTSIGTIIAINEIGIHEFEIILDVSGEVITLMIPDLSSNKFKDLKFYKGSGVNKYYIVGIEIIYNDKLIVKRTLWTITNNGTKYNFLDTYLY